MLINFLKRGKFALFMFLFLAIPSIFSNDVSSGLNIVNLLIAIICILIIPLFLAFKSSKQQQLTYKMYFKKINKSISILILIIFILYSFLFGLEKGAGQIGIFVLDYIFLAPMLVFIVKNKIETDSIKCK